MNYTLRDPNGNVLLAVESSPVKSEESALEIIGPLAILGGIVSVFSAPFIIRNLKEKTTMRKIDNICNSHPDCLKLLQSRNADYLRQVESVNKNLPKLLKEFKNTLPDSLDVKVIHTTLSYNSKSYDEIAKTFNALKKYSKSTLAMYNDPYLKKPFIIWTSLTTVATVIEKPSAASVMDVTSAGVKAAGSLVSAISNSLGYEKIANVANVAGNAGSKSINTVSRSLKTNASVDLISAQELLQKFVNDQVKAVPNTAVCVYFDDTTKTINAQIGVLFTNEELHTTIKPLIDVLVGKNKIM